MNVTKQKPTDTENKLPTERFANGVIANREWGEGRKQRIKIGAGIKRYKPLPIK